MPVSVDDPQPPNPNEPRTVEETSLVDVSDRAIRQLGIVSVGGIVDIGEPVDSQQYGPWTVTANQGGSWLAEVTGVVGIEGPVAVTGAVTVSGTVAATQSGSWAVTVPNADLRVGGAAVGEANPVPIDGSVSVDNIVPVAQSGTWSVGLAGTPQVDVLGLPETLTDLGHLKVAVMEGGGGGAGGPVDVEDRVARLLGHVTVDNQPTVLDIADRAGRIVGHVTVDNLPAQQEVTVSGLVMVGNWPVTQPVSGTLAVSSLPALPAGAATIGKVDVNGTVPVSGTFWQATQPVSGTFWQATQPVSLATVPTHPVSQSGTWNVGVTNWPATQAVSLASMPVTPASQSGAWSVSGTGVFDVTPVSPAATDYLPVRLTDGAAFYTAGGGGSGGTVTQGPPGTLPWLTRPVGLPTFYALADNVAFAAAKQHISILNAVGSGKVVKVKKIFAINLQTAAITGVTIRFDVKRITTLTGGTAITPATMDTTNAALTGVTVATGGVVTEGALLFPWLSVNEENTLTQALTIAAFQQMNNLILEGNEVQEPVLRPGEGLTVKQATTSIVGTYAWLIAFTVE
jgi:hypothetical protein